MTEGQDELVRSKVDSS